MVIEVLIVHGEEVIRAYAEERKCREIREEAYSSQNDAGLSVRVEQQREGGELVSVRVPRRYLRDDNDKK